MKDTIKTLPVKDLYPFEQNPYHLRDDPEFLESVAALGVLEPLLVRPREGGGYEVISGHQRRAACEEAGITSVPAIIRSMNDTAAVLALVDSNLHREHILPSEKAFAYKLKLDALKHQGVACGQEGHKSRDEVAEGESGRQVQRYIRLTELLPPILQMVDEGKVAMGPAVELSYLAEKEQRDLLETMQSEDRTPNPSQAQRLRRLSAEGKLDMDAVFAIMTEEKPNQREHIKLPAAKLKGFFPKSYSPKQMEETILKLLGEWQKKRERSREAER